jgi:AraC-like DNA-binding protein
MTLTLTFPAILYMIAVVLGTITSLICWMYPHNKRSSIKWLGASLFSLTWTLLIFFLGESRLIYYVPHLYQTSFIATLLYMPFSYFFIRSAVHGTQLTWRDLVHAIPLLLFLIDYSPIYLLTAANKLHMIEAEQHSAYIYQHGWFVSGNLHRPLRFVLFMVYSGLQFRLALSSTGPEKKRMMQYLTAQFALVIYYTLYQITLDPFIWRAINVMISMYIVFIAIALLFHPQILYSYELATAEKKLVDRIRKHDLGERTDGPRTKQIEQICSRMENLMISEQPFLRHGYSIHDLSGKLQIPSYQLSAILNHHLNTSFNEYLNKYRIAYCKERIVKGAAQTLTLEALAFECGFNNRNSFTSAFKHFCGITPSDFTRLQKNTFTAAKDS